jgi:hypothetical protein
MRRVLRFVPMLLIFSWIGWAFVPRRLPRPELLDALPVPVEASIEGQTADAILERMRTAYASVEAYRDEGWTRNLQIEGDERKVWSVEHFRVVLSRPDRMVWQWRELHRHRSSEGEFVDLLQRGDEVRFHSTHWSETSLETRMAAFARFSTSTWHAPLRLLFHGELGGRNWFDRLVDLRVVGIERFDEHACFRIEGILPVPPEIEPTPYAFWIDCESHLLRRLTVRDQIADWIMERVLVFSPRAGDSVAERELELDESF